MFAKLIKHEWLGCRQILRVLCCFTLGAGLLSGLTSVFLTYNGGQKGSGPVLFLFFFSLLALGICSAAAFLYLIWRFYQSRFTDEGYLTFTLPVTSHQLLLSSFVNILRGSLLVLLSVIGSLFLWALVYAIAFFPSDVAWNEIFQLAAERFPDFLAILDWAAIGKLLVFSVFSALGGILILMLCVTLGSVLARKHRFLSAAAVLFLISLVRNISFFSLLLKDGFQGLLCNSLITAVVPGMISYLLIWWITDKKLNLN